MLCVSPESRVVISDNNHGLELQQKSWHYPRFGSIVNFTLIDCLACYRLLVREGDQDRRAMPILTMAKRAGGIRPCTPSGVFC